jgi:hypothetical protein
MSGGAFDYNQSRIQYIIEGIEEEIERSGKKIDYESGYSRGPWELEYNYEYPPDIINEFKNGLRILKQAYVYTQRIDWLLSGDDGEDSFRKRLKEDLAKLNPPTLWDGESGY